MENLSSGGHPIFRATSALDRGQLKSKEGGKLSIHFCEDEPTIETIFRDVVSANQLSITGQFFLTKDAEAFSEFDGHVGCREYTIPRDGESSIPKGWIRENTKIGLALQVTTNYHQGKPRIEVRIASLSGDGSHSCVRISNGLNTLVTDLTENTRIHGDDENNSASTGRPCRSRNENRKTFSN